MGVVECYGGNVFVRTDNLQKIEPKKAKQMPPELVKKRKSVNIYIYAENDF